jgi:hypothetical protein
MGEERAVPIGPLAATPSHLEPAIALQLDLHVTQGVIYGRNR